MIEWYAHESESPYLPSCFPIRWTFRNCPPSHRFLCQKYAFPTPIFPLEKWKKQKCNSESGALGIMIMQLCQVFFRLFFLLMRCSTYFLLQSRGNKIICQESSGTHYIASGWCWYSTIKVPFKTLSSVPLKSKVVRREIHSIAKSR